jgi:HEAT repeat protein
MSNRPAVVRRTIVEALGRIGDSQALAALIEALADSDDQVREKAAESLGRLNDKRAAPSLLRALDDPSWKVRYEATRAAGALKDVEALPLLRDRLKTFGGEPNHYVREVMQEAIAAIGGKPYFPYACQGRVNL